ncbi:MAG: DUF4013 domain-containing protein [Deltaproteobacteria bacterium]|nr:DUF4013 domain-containing protein [Deltaproteobacteria bacterium]
MAVPSISFERSLGYPMKDPNWLKKVLLGGVFTLIPIAGILFLLGFMKKLFLTLVQDENALIPELDLGADLSAGLGVLGVGICWGLMLIPAMLLMIIPVIGPLAYMAIAATVVPVALMRYFTTGQFGAAFEFKAIFAFIKENSSNVLMMFAVSFVAQLIAGFGIIACFVGILFTGFWALLVRTHAMAAVWRASQVGAIEQPRILAPPVV